MSWNQLLDTCKQARIEFENDPYVRGTPESCPLCGEPLLPGPPSEAGILYCRFDGWQAPRDWTRPEPPAGLYDGVTEGPGYYSGLP